MAVNIEEIKKLREMTGVSMSACKSALEESNGDVEAAIAVLRKKGEAKAADRSERTTLNGVISAKVDGSKASMTMLLCETDFVSRSDDFITLVDDINNKLFAGEISESDVDLDILKDAGLKLGENLKIGGLKIVNAPVVGSYVHSNKSIGVLVGLSAGTEELARDIAMHAAAMNPSVVSPDNISNELVEKEKEIWIEQLKTEGKPEAIMANILIGKERKFREDNALIKQNFVKNPEVTIEKLLKDASAEIVEYARFSV